MHFPAILAELIGTFIFFFVIVATGNAYAIGATLTLVILLFGKLSGGHFNPGVTMMMLWKENVFMDTAIMFMIVQVVAGIAAVETWRYLVSAGLLPSKK